jgi:nitrate reductase gamma subunit
MKTTQLNSLIQLVLIVAISGLSVYAASGSSSGPPLIFLAGFYLFGSTLMLILFFVAFAVLVTIYNLEGPSIYVLREYLREDYFLFFLLGALILLGFYSIIQNPAKKGRLFFVSCVFLMLPMAMGYSKVDWIPLLKGMGGWIPLLEGMSNLVAKILKHFYTETNLSFEVALVVSFSVIFLSIILHYSLWIGDMINEFKEKGGIIKDLGLIYHGVLMTLLGIILVIFLVFGILINTVWRAVEMMREPVLNAPVTIVTVGIGATVLIMGSVYLWWRRYRAVRYSSSS